MQNSLRMAIKYLQQRWLIVGFRAFQIEVTLSIQPNQSTISHAIIGLCVRGHGTYYVLNINWEQAALMWPASVFTCVYHTLFNTYCVLAGGGGQAVAHSHAEGPCALEPALPVRRLCPVAAVHAGEALLSQLSLSMCLSQLYTSKLSTLPERQQEIRGICG